MRTFLVVGACLLASVVAFGATKLAPKPSSGELDENGVPLPLEDLSWFWHGVGTADSLILFEGLPHPVNEPDSFIRESTSRTVAKIAKESFYSEPWTADEQLSKRLTEGFQKLTLFTVRPRGHRHWGSLCCIFHADYGIRWQRRGERTVDALVCFGCDEIQLLDEKRIYHTRLTPEGSEYLRAALIPHRRHRPPVDRTRSNFHAEIRKRSPVPSTAVELPNDVAQKAVQESTREPLADEVTDFWWLESLLPPQKPADRPRR